MKKIILLLLVVSAINLFADNSAPANQKYPFNYGKMEDTVYTNPFFGFKIAIPSGWTIQNKTQIDYVMSKGKEIIEFKDEAINKAVDNIDVNSMTLLMVSKYEMGAPVKFNPSVIVLAESVLMSPGVKTGSDYLFHVKNGLTQSNLNYSCVISDSTLKINKFNFHQLSCAADESLIQQNYYTAIIKKYAFSFIITFSNEEEENEIRSIINSAVFTK